MGSRAELHLAGRIPYNINQLTPVKYAPSLVKYFRASNFTGQVSHFTGQAN